MQITIEPGNINGEIAAPPSKSMTQRAYAGALLHKGTTHVRHAGNSDDENAALHIIKQMGADVISDEDEPGAITINSNGLTPISDIVNCGESGLAARLFTPIAAVSDKPMTITGQGSLLQRPMNGFADVLPLLGITLSEFNGHLPITLQGPMQARDITLDASGGSQFLSGLLFALTVCAKEPVTITVADLASKPYIDMTLQTLAGFGKPVDHNNYKEFYIDPAKFNHQDTVSVNVEGDWSSASFFLVAGAIAGDVTVRNLDLRSAQADRAILGVLQDAGVRLSIADNFITARMARLQAFDFDATDAPDLFPVLSILAACCEGESYITGVQRLFHKESNRAESISEMLQNFDVPFSLEGDILCITGVRRLQGTIIDSYADHRIAMAAAIGALRAGSRVDIMGAEAVNKSYPAFFEDLGRCGVKCKNP